MEIRLAGVVEESTVDGPGIRYTVFTQGCLHNCKGCHNPQTHPLDGGYVSDTNHIIAQIKKNSLITGITISGGEPFLQPNPVLELIKEAKKINMDVLVYSGYTFEELHDLKNPVIDEILKVADYLVDGRFEIAKKSYTLLFKGSSNQRIIDLQETLKQGKVIEKDFSIY